MWRLCLGEVQQAVHDASFRRLGEFQATFCPHVVLPCPGTIPPGGKVTFDTGLGAIFAFLGRNQATSIEAFKTKTNMPFNFSKRHAMLLPSFFQPT